MARGVDDPGVYLTAPDQTALRPPFPMAVGMWWNSGIQNNFRYLLSKLLLANQHPSYGFGADGSGNLRFLIGWGTTGGNVTVTPTAPAATVFNGLWHHILGTYDGTTARLYVDGVQAGAGTPETRAIAYAGLDLYVGNFDGSQLPTVGAVAELAVWSAIPDTAEIAALAQGFIPTLIRPADLNAYWPLIGRYSPETDPVGAADLTVVAATTVPHCRRIGPTQTLLVGDPAPVIVTPAAPVPAQAFTTTSTGGPTYSTAGSAAQVTTSGEATLTAVAAP